MTPESKEELSKEIENKKQEIVAIQAEIKDCEKYEDHRSVADELKKMKQAYIDAGFTDVEAFELVKAMFKQATRPRPLLGGF